MTDPPLPRRRFTELAAPPGGLATVRAEAACRHRRRGIVTGSGAGVVGVAVLVVVLLVGGHNGSASLRQLPLSGGNSGQPSASTSPTTTAAPSAQPTKPNRSPAQTPPASPGVNQATASLTATGAPAQAGYRTPNLVRSNVAHTGPPTVCQGSSVSGQNQVSGQFGWCLTAVVGKTPDGRSLTVSICRVGATDATLTYTSTTEVDLIVSHANTQVWRWSPDHPAQADNHGLTTTANTCWHWTLDWTVVDQHGQFLLPGTYTFTAVTKASELQSNPQDSVTFTL